jgi:hypothetical protein
MRRIQGIVAFLLLACTSVLAAAGSCRWYARVLQTRRFLAVSACNTALRLLGKDNSERPTVYGSRSMARFRQGDFAKAPADVKEGLKLDPENRRARFARFLAEMRLNMKSTSERPEYCAADGAEYRALLPAIWTDALAQRHSLKPSWMP